MFLIRKQKQILHSIRYFLLPFSRTIAEVNYIFLAKWLIKPHTKFAFPRNNSGVIGNDTALHLYEVFDIFQVNNQSALPRGRF